LLVGDGRVGHRDPPAFAEVHHFRDAAEERLCVVQPVGKKVLQVNRPGHPRKILHLFNRDRGCRPCQGPDVKEPPLFLDLLQGHEVLPEDLPQGRFQVPGGGEGKEAVLIALDIDREPVDLRHDDLAAADGKPGDMDRLAVPPQVHLDRDRFRPGIRQGRFLRLDPDRHHNSPFCRDLARRADLGSIHGEAHQPADGRRVCGVTPVLAPERFRKIQVHFPGLSPEEHPSHPADLDGPRRGGTGGPRHDGAQDVEQA
jgi:hypothetical protein